VVLPDGLPDEHESGGAPAPVPTARAAAPGEARRAAPVVAVVLAVVLVVLLVVGAAVGTTTVSSLQHRNDQWRATSAAWEKLAHDAATSEASARTELAQREADLAAVKKQLAAAKKRITALADEKAQLADKSAGRQQQLDYQARVSQAAGDVTAALDKCVAGQEQLIAYLDDASRYDADDLARFRADVSSVCGDATKAGDALQSVLSAG